MKSYCDLTQLKTKSNINSI